MLLGVHLVDESSPEWITSGRRASLGVGWSGAHPSDTRAPDIQPFTTSIFSRLTLLWFRVVVGAGGGRANADSKVDFADQVIYTCSARSVATDQIQSRPHLDAFALGQLRQGY